MKIGMVTMEYYENRRPGSVGSSRIRGDWIAEYWDECEMYKTGRDYDCMIFQKAYWEDMVKKFEGIKIFDLCDADWLQHRPVIEMINYCDGVVVSTEALAEQIRKFDIGDTPVVCIPDRVNLDWSKPRHPKHERKAESVVYFGYSQNAKVVLEPAVDPLHKRGLKLTVIADAPYNRNDFYVPYDVETVNENIVEHDIVLLPEAPSNKYWFQFKSNNKTIQSWGLRMPVATNGEELDKFMEGEEREKEVEKRFQEVKDKWDVRISVEEWKDFVNKLKNKNA